MPGVADYTAKSFSTMAWPTSCSLFVLSILSQFSLIFVQNKPQDLFCKPNKLLDIIVFGLKHC